MKPEIKERNAPKFIARFRATSILLLFMVAAASCSRSGTEHAAIAVEVSIGDIELQIPEKYIWFKSEISERKTAGINLFAAARPNGEYVLITPTEYKSIDNRDIVTILVAQHGIKESVSSSTSMTRKEVYQRLTSGQRAAELSAHSDLRLQSFNAGAVDWSAKKEMYTADHPPGSLFWLLCDRDGQVKLEQCETYTELSDHSYVRYTIAKENLSQWRGIDEEIINLINSFRTNAELNTGELE